MAISSVFSLPVRSPGLPGTGEEDLVELDDAGPKESPPRKLETNGEKPRKLAGRLFPEDELMETAKRGD